MSGAELSLLSLLSPLLSLTSSCLHVQARDNTLTPVTIRMLLDASYAAGAKNGANYKGVQLAQVSGVSEQRPADSPPFSSPLTLVRASLMFVLTLSCCSFLLSAPPPCRCRWWVWFAVRARVRLAWC